MPLLIQIFLLIKVCTYLQHEYKNNESYRTSVHLFLKFFLLFKESQITDSFVYSFTTSGRQIDKTLRGSNLVLNNTDGVQF